MADKRLDKLFEGKSYEVMDVLPVMWLGWECDSEAYIVKVEGEGTQLVTSNHGSLELQSKGSALTWLEDKIKEYNKILTKTSLAKTKLLDDIF